MKFAFAVSGFVLAAQAAHEDEATMLSVSAISNSIKLAAQENSETTLHQVAKAQDPRKAAELLQEFAINNLEAGQGIDDDTRLKLIGIRDILTNETYVALEQAHVHDQDLLNQHAKAINECAYKHIMHLQQDIEGQEVNLVRDTEATMYKCQGVPQRVVALEVPKYAQGVADDDVEGTWEDAAVDEYGNYDPTKDPDGSYARKAVRSGPNEDQIAFGKWLAGEGGRPETRETGHRFWSNWTGVNDPKYDDPNFVDCSEAHAEMFKFCDELHDFIEDLPKPNCQPPIGTTEMEVPTCDGSQPVGVDSDLYDWFTNMKENALWYQGEWQELKKKCDDARDYYKDICLDECARRQRVFEQSFCSYRQGLHATCREYQGCHILSEKEFLDLLKTVMANADGRKIDWKAIHKIECYINVLISDQSNAVRAKSLLNCEAGNLNTIETILTGFNETNYLRLIAPEINASCWNLDVPQFIDWKECDMTSVKQYPCTEQWMDRYNGLTAPAECTECAPIPDAFQYHMDHEGHKGAKLEEYGGGWYYVHELQRSATDIDDLTPLTVGGYHLPTYVTSGLRWNEVLIQRVSKNWCDSWGLQSSYWAEDESRGSASSGASMCIQSDNDYVYCMNNANKSHSWRQQPASHFTVNCGGESQPACDCWPQNKDNLCAWYHLTNASGPTLDNVEAPRHIRILSMEEDGSVVKISFQGQEKSGKLTVGNYNAFLGEGKGCEAITPVKYRVYVRCLGCATNEDGDFHVFDGIQFNGQMTMGHVGAGTTTLSRYTYEGWVRSPLVGKERREIFGGSSAGLTLTNEGAVPCLHKVGSGYMKGGKKERGYQLHVGGTDKYGAFCLEEDTWYHVAATKNLDGEVHIYVNGRDVTEVGPNIHGGGESTLLPTVGGGFVDGGQLFNLRIWSYARTQLELYSDAFATRFEDMQTDCKNGLEHWWPLTHDLQDVMTQSSLVGPKAGPEVRYKPVWWSDLEISGMRGNWKAGYGLPFGDSHCGGAGVGHQTCGAKNKSLGCVYVHKDRVEQCNYIGGNHIDDWGCYSDVSDNCEPKLQAGLLKTENTYKEGSFVLSHSFEMVFAKIPVVVATMGSKGPHSAHVQIFDVSKSGFKYAIMEPHGWDSPHIAEDVHFVAAVPGVSELTHGITMDVGFVETAETVGEPSMFTELTNPPPGPPPVNTVTGQYKRISFEHKFNKIPALLTGIQTMNNQDVEEEAALRIPWIVPAVKALSEDGFKLSLDRCEAQNGIVASEEKVGYIAVTPGFGRCQKTSCQGEQFSAQHANTFSKNMGWDDQHSTSLEAVSFHEHFASNNVIAVASKSTRAGNNGGWMRILDVNKSTVTVVVDEDTSNDDERHHIPEDVGVVAFSSAFVF